MNRAAVARIVSGCVTAVAVSVLFVASASAGTYTVSACSPFTTPGPFSEVNTDAAGLTAESMCGGPAVGPLGNGDEGALFAQDNAQNAGAHIPGGARAGWSFSAPAGTTITGVSYYRSLESITGDLIAGLFQAGGGALEACQGTLANDYMCSVPNNQAPATFSGLSTTELFFGVECQLQPSEEYCLSGSPEHQLATADMYSVTVTLSEQATPSVTEESGPLWNGSVVSGTVPLDFQASDPSGIERVAVSDGGTVAANMQESCDFTNTVPCPQLQPGGLNVDTTRLRDGSDHVTLVITDAAGNTTVVTSPALVVDNNGPAAPTSLTASAVGPGSNMVNLAWSNPANPPQPATSAYAQLCQASCAPAISVSTGGAAQIAAAGPGSYTVRVWLTDAAGKGGPQNAATTSVSVPAAPAKAKSTGSTGTRPVLHLSARRHGDKLIVTVTTAAGEDGPVTVRLDMRRHKRLVLASKRKLKPMRHTVRTVWVLSRRERRAAKLVLIASATGARSARLTMRTQRSG